MKKVISAVLLITGFFVISSCSLFKTTPTTPYDEYPYAADGDGYIVPNGRLVHKSLKCPNLQSTSGYKRVSSSEHWYYGYSTCYDCYFMK